MRSLILMLTLVLNTSAVLASEKLPNLVLMDSRLPLALKCQVRDERRPDAKRYATETFIMTEYDAKQVIKFKNAESEITVVSNIHIFPFYTRYTDSYQVHGFITTQINVHPQEITAEDLETFVAPKNNGDGQNLVSTNVSVSVGRAGKHNYFVECSLAGATIFSE